ncbi:uncharacterized protein LOC116604741 [Nematostella vectensis]|uniref:uncharacterized protein LOC116604741 n=1 Tax=Nematostella vectensis TaxID=45351 RepID=UPI00139058E4|nr:uncharacterized protein LOC116604741 [Nematostella vectensis]
MPLRTIHEQRRRKEGVSSTEKVCGPASAKRVHFKDETPQRKTDEKIDCGGETPPFSLSEVERREKPLRQREREVEATIKWLYLQIKILQQQDQDLMRQFTHVRTMLNAVQDLPYSTPAGRKISLPEEAITAYGARRLSESTTEPTRDYRRRSYSAFSERISFFSSMTSPSSMEELKEI